MATVKNTVIGPVQVILFSFDRTDQFRGEVLEELRSLRGRGLIRLLDLFLALKDASGEIVAVELNDLSEQESAEFGKVVGKLLGVSSVSAGELAVNAVENILAAASETAGLDHQDLRQVVEGLPPGKAFGVLMFEHTWAIPLRDAIRRAGGIPLTQGFITPEALLVVGEELRMIAEAERTLEVAEIVKSAAILDTLATLQEAEAIKTAIAADVVRTLAIANLIEETAIAEAIETLTVAGLLESQYLDDAARADTEEATEDKQFFMVDEN
jgi:uncharacterized membrane protein